MRSNAVAASRSGAKFFGTLAMLAVVVCLLPGTVAAAGLSFLPAATQTDIHPERPDLSVLTYPVPGGLLVADRLASGQETRFGAAFTPHFKASEFYLVQG